MHVEPMRVAWSDTDAGGRIHWSAVFRWAESAEHAWLRRLGASPDDTGSYPRRATEATYHHPLRFGQSFEVHLTTTHLGTSSVTFAWTITSDGLTCVTGRHTVVHVGPDGRPAAWPESLRKGLGAG
ncbi:thioesterase family protein [Streptomyces sp. NPDC004539]|uniref:acyl-CoA thioesterase n=1 Tax=Streptomyces sp. NPDC004539 TaxID=3154280 RepID=UPI0033B70570